MLFTGAMKLSVISVKPFLKPVVLNYSGFRPLMTSNDTYSRQIFHFSNVNTNETLVQFGYELVIYITLYQPPQKTTI